MKSLPEIKDEIKDRVDLGQIVAKHTKLVKTSTGFKACCPLPGHKEKTPSFNVDARKNLYFCYGCQKGGDVFKFLEEVEGLSFMEALKELAETLQIELPKMGAKDVAKSKEQKSNRERGLEALNRSGAYYAYVLQQKKTPGAEKAWDYLINTRGLSAEEIEDLQLGFAPEAPDMLSKKLKEAGLLDVAQDAGLSRTYNGITYDFFQDRLMIPIKDRRGRIIAFSGRTLSEITTKNPKYKNSPESSFFKKKEVLYGLDRAIPLINQSAFVCLVEGFFDQWAFHRRGIPSVAVMGTALTPEHIKELQRFTNKMILVLDADKAGVASTKRSLPLLQEASWDIRVFSEMKGKDPDEWLKAEALNVDQVLKTLNDAPDGLEWLILKTLEEARQEQLGRHQTLRRIKELWSRAVDSSHKALLLNPIAAFMGLKNEELKESLEQVDSERRPQGSYGSKEKSTEISNRYEPFKDHPVSKNSWDRAAEELLVYWIRHWDELCPVDAEGWMTRMEMFDGSMAFSVVNACFEKFSSTGESPSLELIKSLAELEGVDPLLRRWLYRGMVAPERSKEAISKDKALISFRELSYSLRKEKTQVEIARIEQEIRKSSDDMMTVGLLQKVQTLKINLENKD